MNLTKDFQLFVARLRTGFRCKDVFRISLLTLCASVLPVWSFARAPATSSVCNQPTPQAISYVDLPGNLFMAVPSQDGCWVFVSLGGGNPGIAVLQRSGGTVTLVRVVPLRGHPGGMALTHDGKLLLVANGEGVAFLDLARLIGGQPNAVLGYLRSRREIPPDTRLFMGLPADLPIGDAPDNKPPSDPSGPRFIIPQDAGSIQVAVTKNDRFLFVSDENSQAITVIDLRKARRFGFAAASVIGRIPVAVLPVGLTLSPDERYLYSTGEIGLRSYGWPADCKPEGNNGGPPQPDHLQGGVLVVDVAKAKAVPGNAVVARVAAGCSPVRVVISPKGDTAFVTARNSDAVLAFDTRKMFDDPTHALTGSVPVGTAPGGLAVIDDGHKIVVTNSNRFSGGANNQQTLTVIDASKTSSGADAVFDTIPAGAFPREIKLGRDQRTLFVNNFGSKTLEVVDLSRQIKQLE